MFDAAAWVGRTVLGEHRLGALAREDDVVALYEATSVVDGGKYAVAVPKHVVPETGSMALEEAVGRAGRHAVGASALLPLLHARVEGEGAEARTGKRTRTSSQPALSRSWHHYRGLFRLAQNPER